MAGTRPERCKRWIRSQPAWIWIAWLALVALHLYRLDVTWFSIDQTRDLLQATDIAAGRHFPLIGPEMRWIGRIGPLYYYFLALPLLVVSHPYAAYVFLAFAATLTAACGYYLLRRYFSARAASLFLVLFAPSTIALIDSRALWTPAFLPLWSTLSLWAAAMFLWEKRPGGLVALAAIVGIATQFHLSFVLIVPVVVVGCLIHRPPIRPSTIVLAVAAVLVTQAPYLFYQASHDWVDVRAFLAFAGHASESAGEAASSPAARRLLNYFLIPYRLADDFLRLKGIWLGLFRTVALAFSFLLVASAVAMALRAVRRDARQPEHAARKVFLLVWFGLPLAALLARSQELYYYYFDLLLPLPFFIPAIAIDDALGMLKSARWRHAASVLGIALLVLYAVVQTGAFLSWSSTTARSGLLEFNFARLDLHRFQDVSSRPPEQFVPLRYKVALARALVRDRGWSRRETYVKVFGSRFYDATEERGFWLAHFESRQRGPAAESPIVLWHVSDPLQRWAEEMNVTATGVGSFRLAELAPDISPHPWRHTDGTEVSMPVRVVPELREYGFVPETSWPPGPVRLHGRLAVNRPPSRYLLVVITKGEKLAPRLVVNGRAREAAQRSDTLTTAETFFLLDHELVAGENALELEFDHQGNFDLDVFAWAKR